MRTQNQPRQLEFLEKREPTVNVYCDEHYDCKCWTCGTSIDTAKTSDAKEFISSHQGHNTWMTYFGKMGMEVL